MSAAALDAQERAELCDLLLELGPEAPTLCEGWTTLDMAAHLVIRETDPRSGLAILGGSRFDGLETRLMDRAKARGLDVLVGKLRTGPPMFPWRVPGLRSTLNLNEWFVHHEDVRRPNGRGPRAGRDDLEAALWTQLGRGAWLMLRGVRGAGVDLVAPGHGERPGRQGRPRCRITGSPGEITLYLNGRRDAAQVELTGDEVALRSLAAARLGV